MNRIWSRKLTASDKIWLIGLIGYEDKIRIMSIYANDYRQVLLPIREGSTFTENNTSEALTGSNVPTFQSNNKEYIFLFFDGPGVSRVSWLKGKNSGSYYFDQIKKDERPCKLQFLSSLYSIIQN